MKFYVSLIFGLMTMMLLQSCHVLYKNRIFYNALDVVYSNDSIIHHYGIDCDTCSQLFDISNYTMEHIFIFRGDRERLKLHFNDLVVNGHLNYYNLEKAIRIEKDLVYTKVPTKLRQSQFTNSHNWLIFSRYNKKYKVMSVIVYLNVFNEDKHLNLVSIVSNVSVTYTILFDKKGRVKDVLYGAAYY